MIIEEQVLAFFGELEKQVAQFQIKTGLRCSPGCGRCCPTAAVHTTVLEMLPAAGEILRQGASDHWLSVTSQTHTGPGCVFYQAEETAGHCRFYAWRPGVCRLFGFASVRTRTGGRALSVCNHLKTNDPATVAAAMTHAADAPCLSDLCTRLHGIDPSAAKRLFPINEAIRIAIQRMGLYIQMASGEKFGRISAA